jgi:DHA1 family bicyclomycin/chloramphenicol resistance-like MFS transporter
MEQRANKAQGFYESIALYAFLGSITGVSLDILLPAYSAISESFNVNQITELQKTVLAFICGMFFGELVSGYFCDRNGRKITILTSIVIYLVGSIVCFSSHDFNMLLIGRIIQGIGAAGQKISVRTTLRDRFQGAQLAKTSSFILMTLIFTPFVAPLIGKEILQGFNWRGIFIFLTVFSSCSACWYLLRHDETLDSRSRNTTGLRIIVKIFFQFITNIKTIGYTTIAGLFFGIQLAFISLSPLIFKDIYNIDKNFPIYFGFMACGFGIALFVNGRIVSRYGMQLLSLLALLLILLSGAALTVITLCCNPPNFFLFFCLIFLTLFSIGIVFGNIIALTLEPLGNAAGLGSAFSSSISTIIALCVSHLSGTFYDGTITSFSLMLLICAAAALPLCVVANKSKITLIHY